MESNLLLEVRNLSLTTKKEHLNLLDQINFYMRQGETVGLVGESGCGKSISALSIMRLHSEDEFAIQGSIRYKGRELLSISEKEMISIRGKDISMIFQEPTASLNPVMSVGNQIMEMILLHRKCSKKAAREIVIEQLQKVSIASPEEMFYTYPHELSGGMCQRVMIAMAMANRPRLLIADEPTTALDVTIQAQILELMSNLKKEHQMGILLITHDLGVVAQVCDRVVVMYAGRIAEAGTVEEIFNFPKHPYTVGLLKSVPNLTEKKKYLDMIPGFVPPPLLYEKNLCRFKDRCPQKIPECNTSLPCAKAISPTHIINCHLIDKEDQLCNCCQ